MEAPSSTSAAMEAPTCASAAMEPPTFRSAGLRCLTVALAGLIAIAVPSGLQAQERLAAPPSESAPGPGALTPPALENLPLNPFRNYQSLIILLPGALPPTFANAENDTPQRSLTPATQRHEARRLRTASASPSSRGTVVSQPRQPSVTD